jgi:voltage-gated potassium channel
MQPMDEPNTSDSPLPFDDVRGGRPPSAYDLFISAAAVVAIGVLIWAWTLDRGNEIKHLLMIFDWAFCVLFFVDFLHNLFTAKRKLRYLYTWGPFDLISSIPVIGPFRLARLGALFRVLRIFRSVRILSQVYMRDKAASLVAVLMIAGIGTIIGVSVAVLHVEKSTPGASILTGEDAAWWSVVTVSTVGYGNIVPITPVGRVLAVELMVVGIGLFATFAGAIANIFMRQVQKTTNVDSLEDRLVRMERHQHDLYAAVRKHIAKQNPDD